MASEFRIVLTTAPDAETADRLAAALVESRLAACVNAVPGIASTYRWEGKVETAREVLLVIKTKAGLVPELARAIKERHPYKLPEVISLPILEGSVPYLEWLAANTLVAEPREESSPSS